MTARNITFAEQFTNGFFRELYRSGLELSIGVRLCDGSKREIVQSIVERLLPGTLGAAKAQAWCFGFMVGIIVGIIMFAWIGRHVC